MSGAYLVVGGGPCGLAAAWELARAGLSPLVVEAEPLVGGLCATHVRDGWRFDLGGHRFVSSDEDLSRWIAGLLGADLLTAERRSVVLHSGRRFRYPLDARDLVGNLGVVENGRALAGYVAATARRLVHGSPDRTFEEWVTARFGRPLYETFFGPYTEKLWGVHPSSISADWAAERISLLDLGDAALRMLGLRRSSIRTYARRYLYPRLGMGQLFETMARDVVHHGGTVRTGVRVTGLEVEGGRVVAARLEGVHGAERVPVRQLLWTGPLPDLARYLVPAGSPLQARIDAMRFRALTFLNLMLGRREVSENTWMYVASPRYATSRIQEPRRRSAAMAPEGRTSLMLEVPCDVGDATWRADLSTQRARGERELAELGFPVDDVLGAFAVRVAHGYPVYHLGYDRDRRALLGAVGRYANVHAAGRQGLFRYVFMDAAMQMGLTAARSMMRERVDLESLDAIGRARVLLEARAITA